MTGLFATSARIMDGRGTLSGVVSTDEYNELRAAICESRKAVIKGESIDICGLEVLEVCPTGGIMVVVEVLLPVMIPEPSRWDWYA